MNAAVSRSRPPCSWAPLVFENADEGTDTVYSTAHFRLSDNLENLILQGNGDLQGYGNGLNNAIYGNSWSNVINGGAGSDMLTGGQGNDAFIFDFGHAGGDTVVDFAGNGAAAGDWLVFVGYGPARHSPTSTRLTGRSITTAARRTTAAVLSHGDNKRILTQVRGVVRAIAFDIRAL